MSEVPPELTLAEVIKRFALISGTTRIWDRYDRRRLSSSALSLQVGAEIAKQWKAVANKRQIREEDVRELLAEVQAQKQGRGGVAEALERFVYLEVSSEAWDHLRRETTRLDNIKHAILEVYDIWYRHPSRKSIDKNNLVFDPCQKVDLTTHINKFQGLPLKADFDDTKCVNIRRMMWRLCNNDEAVWRWLAKWMAYPLQHLGAKMATAVLMHSDKQGSGKSFLFDGVMRPIYGDYGATLGQHQMESQYNDWQDSKLYGLFEEIFSRDKKYSQTGTMKQMITGKTVRIEKKFVSGWEDANHCNCIFLSNEIQPFPVEPSDRRFLVVWPDWKLELELQQAVDKELKNGGAESFFGWLLGLDIDDFNEHTKPPMTEAKQRLIDFGRPSWDVFYREWSEGMLDAPYHSCLTDDLYDAYVRWCRHGNYPMMSMEKFSSSIAARVDRCRDTKYDEPGCRRYKRRNDRKGAFFIFREHKPADRTQKAWLSGCVANFRKEAGLEDKE
ncbi:MAG: primase-helicase family protein [Motiliproteus sp.]